MEKLFNELLKLESLIKFLENEKDGTLLLVVKLRYKTIYNTLFN